MPSVDFQEILWDFGVSLSESALIKPGEYHNNKNNGLKEVKVKTNLFPISANPTSCFCEQNCSIFRINQRTFGEA
jgi:hypothetical protein